MPAIGAKAVRGVPAKDVRAIIWKKEEGFDAAAGEIRVVPKRMVEFAMTAGRVHLNPVGAMGPLSHPWRQPIASIVSMWKGSIGRSTCHPSIAWREVVVCSHSGFAILLKLRNFEDIRTMLIRLIYVSKAVDPQTGTLADSILRSAHTWNTQNDITGVLCEGQGVFLQALEGERGKVTRLYARIAADPRHTDLELIHCEGITQRRYGEWSMAHVRLSDVDPQTKIVWPEFDPYSANGELVMARIDDLIAGGTRVPPPLS